LNTRILIESVLMLCSQYCQNVFDETKVVSFLHETIREWRGSHIMGWERKEGEGRSWNGGRYGTL